LNDDEKFIQADDKQGILEDVNVDEEADYGKEQKDVQQKNQSWRVRKYHPSYFIIRSLDESRKIREKPKFDYIDVVKYVVILQH
jgi:hypothetical protein